MEFKKGQTVKIMDIGSSKRRRVKIASVEKIGRGYQVAYNYTLDGLKYEAAAGLRVFQAMVARAEKQS